MKKAENVKEFVERIDALKKQNPKDLSSDQDLTIAIMNLISIEEHLVFSGAKTEKTSFYDLVKEIRELRKTLMLQIIPSYEGEVWCISKHLLSASMRLIEVGTKQQSLKRDKKAYEFFDSAYNLYCLFWGLNSNLLDSKDVKWLEEDMEKIQKISDDTKKMEETVPQKKDIPASNNEEVSLFVRLKKVVRKAVDCCIE